MTMVRRATVIVLAAASLLVAAGCSSGEEQPSPQRRDLNEAVAPARFAAVVADPATITLNVHVPDEGSIPGTDLTIAYDAVARQRAALPARDVTIALYCMTGRMSTIARRTLADMGFRRLVELRGGMQAWRKAGRRLLPAS